MKALVNVYHPISYRRSDAPGEIENLRNYFNKETLDKEGESSPPPEELLQACYVGNYLEPDDDILQVSTLKIFDVFYYFD